MPRWFRKRAPWWALLSGAGLVTLAGEMAQAQCLHPAPALVAPGCAAPCPLPGQVPLMPQPGQPLQPLQPPEPGQPAPPTPQEPTATPAPEANFGNLNAGAGFGEQVSLAAPNMLGDLLNGSKSVSFPLIRSGGTNNIFSLGATSITNPAVAENNSPLLQDRVYFRYNYFNDAQSFTGIGPAPEGVPNPEAFRFYDAHQYTFGFEKTCLDGLMSVEVRVPFTTTLANSNIFSVGTFTGFTGGVDQIGRPTFNVTPTPQNTLGHTATQIDNMSVILKAGIFRSDNCFFSGGLAVGIPTAPDTRLLVVDFASTAGSGLNSTERIRDLRIGNDVWALSPYLAFLTTPTNRWFAQGFTQLDFPLNRNKINFVDAFPIGAIPPGFPNPNPSGAFLLQTPFAYQASVPEQSLLHIDFGTGYWLKKDPTASWITGIVPTAEIHYTTTLTNAEVVTLPGEFYTVPQNFLVGNQRNRVDILDLTFGTTLFIGNRATLAGGFSLPVKGVDNRTFDWEAQIQFNYYFGGPRRSEATLFR